MRQIVQGAAYVVTLKLFDSADHVSAKTGATVAVVISKAGGAFGNPNAGATNAVEIANGWYKVALDATDTGTLGDLIVRGTASGADASEQVLQVVAAPSTALDAAGVRSAVGLASANLDTQLGAIAGYIDTEVAAVLSAVDTEVAAIKTKTDNLPSDPADASDIAAAFSTVNGTLAAIAGYVDTEVAAIKAKTDLIPASPAATSDIPSAAAIADAVWDEPIAGHLGAGSTGAAVNAAGSSGDPWSTPLPGAYGAGTAGNILGSRLDAAVSSRMATFAYTAPLDAAAIRTALGLASADLDTQFTTITGRLPAALVSGRMDASVGVIAANVMNANALAADAVTEIRAGLGLASANLDAQLAALAGFIDTEVAAIKAKTDNLPADPADASDIAAAFGIVNATLGTIDGRIDTEVAAIKAKTDNLPGDPADASDIAAALATVVTAVAGLNNLSAAQVRTELAAALSVDTYAEPGAGAPPATASLAVKIAYLYAAWRNRTTQSSAEYALFADDGVTKIVKASVGDDGSTFTRGEMVAGP
jgi:ActR/RegA family two-component response regulator